MCYNREAEKEKAGKRMAARKSAARIEKIFDAYHASLYTHAQAANRSLVNKGRNLLSLDAFVDLVLRTAVQCHLKPNGDAEPSYEEREAFSTAFFLAIQSQIANIQELRSSVPDRFLITNSKLANTLKEMNSDEPEILTVGKKGTLPVEVKSILSFTDKNIVTNTPISEYDKIVHDSVCSLLEAGNAVFTPDMVYRTMNGMTESESVSPVSSTKISESLEKMRHTEISIEYTDQLRLKHPEENITQAFVSGPMLMMQKVTVTAGGNTTTAYKLADVPAVYRYSKDIGQVISVPLALLNTKDVLRSSESVIILRSYLIKRIELMKNKNNRIESDTILFDSLYAALHLTEDTANIRKLKLNARNQCLKVLDYFIEQKYITSYRVKKTGNKLVGVVLDYHSPKELPPTE